MAKKEASALIYKGHPLARSGNTVFYGSMSDKYIISMQIMETSKVGDLDVGGKILIQLLLTDPEAKPKDRVVKQSEKVGLYTAMDIASVWLERALNEK